MAAEWGVVILSGVALCVFLSVQALWLTIRQRRKLDRLQAHVLNKQLDEWEQKLATLRERAEEKQ